ncbi:MAG TPA: hypothetical protein VMH40_10610 [Myxococcaceae bacterium]|nr:hypothetical protein [Myxococcaceae bacterium]
MPSNWGASWRRLFCVLAVLAFPAASHAAPELCKLLTPAQVGAALGGTFEAGEPIGTTGCSWSSAKPHVIVSLSLPPGEWDRLKSSPLPGITFTPASGLGDDAFYATLAPYTMLYVKKGKAVYLFKVYGVQDKAKQMSAEKTLALDALAKL